MYLYTQSIFYIFSILFVLMLLFGLPTMALWVGRPMVRMYGLNFFFGTNVHLFTSFYMSTFCGNSGYMSIYLQIFQISIECDACMLCSIYVMWNCVNPNGTENKTKSNVLSMLCPVVPSCIEPHFPATYTPPSSFHHLSKFHLKWVFRIKLFY